MRHSINVIHLQHGDLNSSTLARADVRLEPIGITFYGLRLATDPIQGIALHLPQIVFESTEGRRHVKIVKLSKPLHRQIFAALLSASKAQEVAK